MGDSDDRGTVAWLLVVARMEIRWCTRVEDGEMWKLSSGPWFWIANTEYALVHGQQGREDTEIVNY